MVRIRGVLRPQRAEVRVHRPRGPRVARVVCVILLFALAACTEAPIPDGGAWETADPPARMQEVITHRSCSSADPGALLPLARHVPADRDPVASAVAELLKGVDEHEAALGCASFFSPETRGALRGVRRNERGDTVFVDFRDFSDALPDDVGVNSFLPPGIMAELTWTLFEFETIDAIRFAFDGDEPAFWSWLAGPGARVEVFTRRDWEQI